MHLKMYSFEIHRLHASRDQGAYTVSASHGSYILCIRFEISINIYFVCISRYIYCVGLSRRIVPGCIVHISRYAYNMYTARDA